MKTRVLDLLDELFDPDDDISLEIADDWEEVLA